VAKLEHLAASSAVLSIGRSVAACGQTLAQRTRTNAYHFDSLTGMAACDRFLQILSQLSGITPDTEFVRERACLQDALLDTHFYLAGKRMALAGESDLLHAFAPLCQDTSITLSFAVVPTLNDSLSDCFAETVMEGDLEDVEMTLSHNAPVDLVVGNSYLVPVCDFHTLPLYRCGYPVFDRLGATRTCQIGYRGTMDLLFGWANLIWSHHTPHPEVYHSTLNPREDSSNETDQKTPFSTH
jgi:nitrogenase molybdenum-iron protein alpha/beta subunit